MGRICGVVALAMAMCVILTWDDTLASPASGQRPPERGEASSRDSSGLATESGRE